MTTHVEVDGTVVAVTERVELGGEVSYQGQYTTWVGSKYDDDRHPNETNKLIRKDIAEAVKRGQLPALKYRVTRAAGSWSSVYISVNVPDVDGWAIAQERDWATDRPMRWTEQAMLVGYMLHAIGDAYMRSTSDIQTDYFAGGSVHVYVSTSGSGGGLCLPRFSAYDVMGREMVTKVPDSFEGGGWAVWNRGVHVESDYQVFGSWAEAVAEADRRARTRLARAIGRTA